MHDALRERLIASVNLIGLAITKDPALCESNLGPKSEETKDAINAIVAAIREGVTEDLRQAKENCLDGIPLDIHVRQLCKNDMVKPDLASWAVESWAKAIGVLEKVRYNIDFRCPICKACGVSLKKIAGRVIKCPKCRSKIQVSIDGTQFTLHSMEHSHAEIGCQKKLDKEQIASEPRPNIDTQNTMPQVRDMATSSLTDIDPLDKIAKAVSKSTSKHKSVDFSQNAFPPIFSNSIGITLRLISPGKFLMGELKSLKEVNIDRPFYLGMFQVTQQEYQFVMGYNPSHFKSPRKPVECVSWEDAVLFCKTVSALPSEKSKGRTYRLPSEAEWEYACRAGGSSIYCFGDDKSCLSDFAWFGDRFGQGPKYVGQKSPNAWGLYDMHGNVAEWCEDIYVGKSGSSSQGLIAKSEEQRVYRGGSWYTRAESCGSAMRHGSSRGYKDNYIGFRLAMDLHDL